MQTLNISMENTSLSQNTSPFHSQMFNVPKAPPPSNAIVLSQPRTCPALEPLGKRRLSLMDPSLVSRPFRFWATALLERTPLRGRPKLARFLNQYLKKNVVGLVLVHSSFPLWAKMIYNGRVGQDTTKAFKRRRFCTCVCPPRIFSRWCD